MAELSAPLDIHSLPDLGSALAGARRFSEYLLLMECGSRGLSVACRKREGAAQQSIHSTWPPCVVVVRT